MELKDRIRRAREAAGLTQAQLGERVGRDAKTVRGWEAGRVPRGSLGAIEKALGVDLSDAADTTNSPTLDAATDAQLLATMANRLAERDQRIDALTRELNSYRANAGRPPVELPSERWAARLREVPPPEE